MVAQTTAIVSIHEQDVKPKDIGGLSHLVDAITALTRLDKSPKKTGDPPVMIVEKSETSTFDDDEVSFGSNTLSQSSSLVHDSTKTIPKSFNFTSSTSYEATRATPSKSSGSSSSSSANNQNNHLIFPQRLMAMLNEETVASPTIIRWIGHGKSFLILKPEVFMQEILPKYFPSATSTQKAKYPSFTRKLNRWGFRQVTRGPDTGAFHHNLFRRDEPELCLQMECTKARKRSVATTAATYRIAVVQQQQQPTQASAMSSMIVSPNSPKAENKDSGNGNDDAINASHCRLPPKKRRRAMPPMSPSSSPLTQTQTRTTSPPSPPDAVFSKIHQPPKCPPRCVSESSSSDESTPVKKSHSSKIAKQPTISTTTPQLVPILPLPSPPQQQQQQHCPSRKDAIICNTLPRSILVPSCASSVVVPAFNKNNKMQFLPCILPALEQQQQPQLLVPRPSQAPKPQPQPPVRSKKIVQVEEAKSLLYKAFLEAVQANP